VEIKTNQEIYSEIEKGYTPLVTKYVKVDDIKKFISNHPASNVTVINDLYEELK